MAIIPRARRTMMSNATPGRLLSDGSLPELYEPEFVRKLERTDGRGMLALSHEHLRRIEAILFVFGQFSPQNPRRIEYEDALRNAGRKASEMVALLARLRSLRNFSLGEHELLEIELLGLLELFATQVANREPLIPNKTGRGRRVSGTVPALVTDLAKIYRMAGGAVTASQKGPFAQFLGALSPLLPEHIRQNTSRNDVKGWFMRCAKVVPHELRGSLQLGKQIH